MLKRTNTSTDRRNMDHGAEETNDGNKALKNILDHPAAKILVKVAKVQNGEVVDGNAFLEENLKCLLALDPSPNCMSEYENLSTRFSYIKKITELMLSLEDCLIKYSNKTTDILLSVSQCSDVSKCFDFLVLYGIIPCLVPKVWISFENKQNFSTQYGMNVSPNQIYNELTFNIQSFLDLIKEPTFRNLILPKHLNALQAGLRQLGHVPIKPGTEIANSLNELKYAQLINEQQMSKAILKELIVTEKDPLMIREIVFILGNKECQKHLKLELKEIFSDLLLQSNGIQIFLKVACDFTAETSQNFFHHGLEEWSSLIHSYYFNSKSNYIKYIIPQVWELLRTNIKIHQLQFRSIAVYCINLLATENHNDFLKYFINPIVNELNNSVGQQKLENTLVSQCIEDFHTLFYLFRNEIWSFNPKLLTHSATIVYNLYKATARGVYYLKSKLEDLVYLIIISFFDSKDHFKLIIFSHYRINIKYNDSGDDIHFEYTEREHQLDFEFQADLILELMDKRADSATMVSFFITLLDMYIDVSKKEYSKVEKFFIIKAMNHLIEKDDIQNSISKNPESVLNFILSMLKEIVKDDTIEINVLSIALTILEWVLENRNIKCMSQLNYINEYLPKIAQSAKYKVFKDRVLELHRKIKLLQNSKLKQLFEKQRSIHDVLFDSRHPLLPCRSYALIELKKMIESGYKSVLKNKSYILITIQENLKNTDSYLYLSAVFTLSSLSIYYPKDILPILCQEYSMPENYNYSTETRLKIGEVLMKTINSLNETIPVYKNLLLNTFMAGVRDNDHLVRASSLSNLADVCRLLRYKLGSIVAEIVTCAKYVLQHDLAVEPRRAAVLLIQMMIQGADTDLLLILEDSLKDISKLLKFQYQCDTDKTVKLHAQKALETLYKAVFSLMMSGKTSETFFD